MSCVPADVWRTGRLPSASAAAASCPKWPGPPFTCGREPCISGRRGSGTVFFSGCTLKCCFCQNYAISSEGVGKEITPRRLGDIFLELEEKEGPTTSTWSHPTQYLPSILSALDLVRHRLTVPVVYNCGGYERPETIQMLDGYVDIYLPDLKYRSSSLSARYSAAPDYFLCASQAIPAMIRQVGAPVISEKEGYPLMERGVIIRHMVLPGQKEDSKALLSWVRDAPAPGQLPHQHPQPVHPLLSERGISGDQPPDHHLRVPAGGGLRRGAGPHGGIYAEKKQRPGGVHAAL